MSHSGIKSPSMVGKAGRAPLPWNHLPVKPPTAANYKSQANSSPAERVTGTKPTVARSWAASQNGSHDGDTSSQVKFDDGSRGAY